MRLEQEPYRPDRRTGTRRSPQWLRAVRRSRGTGRSEPARRELPLPRADRRREDRACSGRSPRGALRRREPDGAVRHERVPGAAHRFETRRSAAGLRRLRRGRPAERSGQAAAVRRASTRSSAPGCLQHPPSDPRRRALDGCAGPDGRLQEHDRDHDLEHRRRPGFSTHGPAATSTSSKKSACYGASPAAASAPSSSTGSTRSSSSGR